MSVIKRGFFVAALFFCVQIIWAAEIHELISSDDLTGVETILASNPEFLEVEDSLGLSPINYASAYGKLEAVKLLVQLGADLDHGDNENSNPLHNASANAHMDIVEYLISIGMDVNKTDDNQNSPLDFATRVGHMGIAGLLIDNGADINVVDRYGGVAIHSAVYSGNLELVELLVDKGADIHVGNTWDVQPIHYAAWRGHTDIVEYLLSKGADINAIAQSGEIPLTWAIVASRFETADYLLEHGSDINYRSPDGSTPIFAAHKTSLEAIQYMLEKGADVNIADTTFTTALIRCGWSGDRQKIQLLLDNGADINARNDWGQSILTHSIRQDSLETIKMLLDNGAKFEYNDCIGDACISMDGSALHQAVKVGSLPITELLLNRGANADFADLRYNRTPLHWAAIKGYSDIADKLLNTATDIELKDIDKRTAIYYAKKYNNHDIVSMLEDHDAKNYKISKNDSKNYLNEKIENGEAAIWYLGHNGWGILTENNFIIIDYWLWQRGADQPSLNNGSIDPEEIADKKITVISTHEHADHYDPRIWEWRSGLEDVTYIMGFQPETEEEYIFLPARKDTMINDIKFTSITSNDSGIGFLMELDGITVFHPGDHANRQRDFSGTYIAEIEFLKEKQPEIDISFMPISGCGFGDLEAVKLGVYRTLEELPANVFFPMHSIGGEYRYSEFIDEMEETTDFKVQSIAATQIGDRYYYKKGKIKL
ncbi:ankyrin repeat domain-containing protein [Candidatus Cloacimonadota bacterium]